jgi:hypothetical protein
MKKKLQIKTKTLYQSVKQLSMTLLEVWDAIENGEVDDKFFELREKIRRCYPLYK